MAPDQETDVEVENMESGKPEDTSSEEVDNSNAKENGNEQYAGDDTKLEERDPFWSFIPQVGKYVGGVVGNEVGTGMRAVSAFPTWAPNYLGETFEFYKENPRKLYKEIISGFTVAIMQVPESIAFSFVAGVPPQSGLQATFWMASITGLLGGKPGMISGAAGALAVVVADLTKDDGVLDYLNEAERLNVLYMTMFVCGLMQIAFAWLRLAMVVRLIPDTGLIGFMDGLAIIIFMAQLPAFQKCDVEPLFVECEVDDRQWLTFTDDTAQLILTLVHVFICMAIMKFFPMTPYIGSMIPASLVGLLVGTFLEHVIFRQLVDVSTRTVEETAAMSGNAPSFDWPAIPSDSSTIGTMLNYAVTLAAIGGVESVLTLQACNEITDTVPKIADSNQELFAQGVANAVCGIFRAMGGDAMIGQSTINIMNGARYRVSSTMSGVFMLLFVVALAPFIELLPVATLTGVLFMVVLSTFQWKTFIILRYGRLSDSITILLVTLIAVFFNLAVGIAAGVVFSALVHAWDSANHVKGDVAIKHDMIINGQEHPVVKYVHVRGAIFFSSARNFINMFDVAGDPEVVVIDFKDALVIDHSAVAAIQGITHRFDQAGKQVLLVNLTDKSNKRLQRTGNHEILNRQITRPDEIQESNHERVDESNFGARLNKIPMFAGHVGDVDDELQRMSQEHPDISIHSKKE